MLVTQGVSIITVTVMFVLLPFPATTGAAGVGVRAGRGDKQSSRSGRSSRDASYGSNERRQGICAGATPWVPGWGGADVGLFAVRDRTSDAQGLDRYQ